MSYNAVKESAFSDSYYDMQDADWDLTQINSRRSLISISQHLIKNNPVSSGIALSYMFDIAGGTVSIKKGRKEIKRKYDINRSDSLGKLSRKIVMSAFTGGDVGINVGVANGEHYVELIESTRINTPTDRINSDNAEGIRDGVVYKKGVITHYWVRALGEGPEEYYKVPAFDGNVGMLLFRAPSFIRPDQSRGVPVLAPVMNMLRYFQDYFNTIMIQARVSASFSAFITSSNPTKQKEDMESQYQNTVRGVAKISPGSIFYLNKGDRVDFASPNRPSDNTDQFIRRIIRVISSGVPMPYEFLNYDLKEVSYSSWKGATIRYNRVLDTWKDDLSDILLQVVNSRERVESLKNKTRVKYINKISFTPNSPLDPEKQARANKIELANIKTKSVQDVCSEKGIDYKQLLKEREQEAMDEVALEAKKELERQKYRDKYGIEFPEDKEDRETYRRPGEVEGDDLDDDDAKARRREDGNW